MELFRELRWLLIIAVSVSLFFPLNVPLAALAYKVQRGTRPLDKEPQEFWVRSALAALGLTLMSWVAMVADYYLVNMDFPADVVHLVLFMLLIPAGLYYFLWIYGFDEISEGVSTFLLYLGLPGLVLVLFLVVGLQFPLALAESWIVPPETTI